MFEQVLDAAQCLDKTMQQDKHLATSREASKPNATSVVKKSSGNSATHWGKGKLYPSHKLKGSAKAVVARQAAVEVSETENSNVAEESSERESESESSQDEEAEEANEFTGESFGVLCHQATLEQKQTGLCFICKSPDHYWCNCPELKSNKKTKDEKNGKGGSEKPGKTGEDKTSTTNPKTQ